MLSAKNDVRNSGRDDCIATLAALAVAVRSYFLNLLPLF